MIPNRATLTSAMFTNIEVNINEKSNICNKSKPYSPISGNFNTLLFHSKFAIDKTLNND